MSSLVLTLSQVFMYIEKLRGKAGDKVLSNYVDAGYKYYFVVHLNLN